MRVDIKKNYQQKKRCHIITYSTVTEGAHFHFLNMSNLANCQFSCPFPSISTLFALYLGREDVQLTSHFTWKQ